MQRIIMITGTSSGIGKYLAESYAQAGHTVIGCSRSKKNDTLNYYHYTADLADEAQIKDMFYDIACKFKRIDNLINNAGIASMNSTLLFPLNVAKTIFEVNFFGTFLCCRESAKIMVKNKHGRIVNISTVAVPLNLEGESIYSAAKSATNQLSNVLAKELAPWNITVNSIGPNPIKTKLTQNIPSKKIDDLINKQIIKRYGTFEDIRNVVDFYLSDKSSFITGQTIYLGGIS